MKFWKKLIGVPEEPKAEDAPFPAFLEFPSNRLNQGDQVFVTGLASGRRAVLALGPLNPKTKDKYGRVISRAGRVLLWVEGRPGPNPGQWDGSQVELHSNPGMEEFGNYLSVWIEGEGSRLRTQLHFRYLPDHLLMWKKCDEEPSIPDFHEVPELLPHVGYYQRGYHREGEVVIDSSEGSGFSLEGAESWFEAIIIWADGTVTTDDLGGLQGRVEASDDLFTIIWDTEGTGQPTDGTISEGFHFYPVNGPISFEGKHLKTGGFLFEKFIPETRE